MPNAHTFRAPCDAEVFYTWIIGSGGVENSVEVRGSEIRVGG